MSPENWRCLMVLATPAALAALYVAGIALGSRALTAPGRAAWQLARAFGALCRVVAPVAYLPLLAVGLGVVAVVPGAWAVLLALGVGRWLLKG